MSSFSGLTFSSGRQSHHGGNGETVSSHEVKLQPGEHVIDINASSGWMIDSLSFDIGKLHGSGLDIRKVGPLGGDGGGKRHPKPALLRKSE